MATKDKNVKAKKVAVALKKGSGRKSSKIHTKVHFYRPKTLTTQRNPKIVKKAAIKVQAAKAFDVIKYPLTTEASMKKLEETNTLVFIVSLTANKIQIKNAVKKLYDIQAEKVNTLIRPDGLKKAYVKLTADYEALDVANKLGII